MGRGDASDYSRRHAARRARTWTFRRVCEAFDDVLETAP